MKGLKRAVALALALALPLSSAGWAAEVVEPEGLPSAASPALPQSPVLSLPSSLPDLAAVSPVAASAELNASWEAQAAPSASASAPGPVAVPALPEAASGLSASSGGGGAPEEVVPAPPIRATRLALAGGWLGMAGLASLTHAPFGHIAPLVVSLFMSFGVSFMWAFIQGAMSSMGPPAPAAPPVPADPREAPLRRRVDALAALHGLPAPKRLKIIDSDARQAQAGGFPADYEVRVHSGILELPDEQQEAVLRHELGHIKHEDSLFTGLTMFLAPLAPAIALTSGIVSDARTWWAVPFTVAAIGGYLLTTRLAEYHADQFSAHGQKTVKPLVEFFRHDTEAPTLLERLASVVSTHPSHARRIARLLRLSR